MPRRGGEGRGEPGAHEKSGRGTRGGLKLEERGRCQCQGKGKASRRRAPKAATETESCAFAPPTIERTLRATPFAPPALSDRLDTRPAPQPRARAPGGSEASEWRRSQQQCLSTVLAPRPLCSAALVLTGCAGTTAAGNGKEKNSNCSMHDLGNVSVAWQAEPFCSAPAIAHCRHRALP